MRADKEAAQVAERLRARGFDFTQDRPVSGGYRFTVSRAPSVDVEEIVASAASVERL